MTSTTRLTPKQQAFVDAYTGNGTAAARAAGYKGNDATLAQVASENLKKPEVLAAIQARNQVPAQVRAAVAAAGRIATRAERQAFWTKVMLDGSERTIDRLRAAELLGRSEADFTEKVLVTGKMTLEQLVESAAAQVAGGKPTPLVAPASTPQPLKQPDGTTLTYVPDEDA